jgi:hypothetical protein
MPKLPRPRDGNTGRRGVAFRLPHGVNHDLGGPSAGPETFGLKFGGSAIEDSL